MDLLPLYRQVAVEFAARHDTPGRMKAKGVITDIIPWRQSRAFFYSRLRRRLAEERVRAEIARASAASLSRNQVTQLLRQWLPAPSDGVDRLWTDNDAMFKWLSDHDALVPHLQELRRQAAAQRMVDAASTDLPSWKHALAAALATLPAGQLREVADFVCKIADGAALQ